MLWDGSEVDWANKATKGWALKQVQSDVVLTIRDLLRHADRPGVDDRERISYTSPGSESVP